MVVAGAAVAAAAATVWMTATADFLAYSWWLAVQKADFILGPVFVGLYWQNRRPQSRFGPILIVAGFVGGVYALQSSSSSWAFSAGLLWEDAIGLTAYALLLTFPTGRLGGLAARLIIVAHVAFATVPAILSDLLLPQTGAGASISGCRTLCPQNALAITSRPELAEDLTTVFRYGVIVTALATAGLLSWRFVTGTPPQRRALAIGTPIGVVFLVLVVTFHLLALVQPDATDLRTAVGWALVAARAAIWYGFLAALIAAQLFAGRALQRLVRESLRRPSWRELEAMLRASLGDPRLRLGFWDNKSRAWSGANGDDQLRWQPDSGLDLKVIRDDSGPAVALLHDSQLNDDPELLRTAGAVALLAAENAELDRASNDALEALRQSRDRIVRAGDRERRKLERNLHDGVQQRLVAIAIELALTRELAAGDRAVRANLVGIQESVTKVVDELREISHGIYPPVLSDYGLAKALRRARPPTGAVLTVRATDIGRHPPELESALYYCCLEAIQNATKHGGPAPRINVTLEKRADELTFQVSDEGPGFDASTLRHGTGFENMRDRLGALDGRLSIVSSPGEGTTVSGSVPLHARVPADDSPRNGSVRQRTL
ncbi:MAG TPA: ATP-binding protein [Gaiellaceae bacterium]|nr:ATP-binding protein [Gaiellaceae bacterium]